MRLVTIRRTFLSLLTGVALLVACGTASGSPVTITGGFTGYSGQTACGFQTLIAGQDKTGSGPTCVATPPNVLALQPLTFGFGPLTSVDFTTPTLPGSILNNVTFAPSANVAVADVGDEFLLGTLTYTNGTWITTGDNAAQFFLTLVTSSPDSSFSGAVLSDSLLLDITVNDINNRPNQNADVMTLASLGRPNGSLPVFELFDTPDPIFLNTGSVQVFGRIVGGTKTTGFAVQDFSDQAATSLVVTRLANYSGGTPDATAAVPEPGTMVLLGTGLAALGRRALKRRA